MKRLKHSGKHRACDRWNGDSGSGTSQETEHTRYLGDDTGYHNISAYNLGIMAITHPTSIALRRRCSVHRPPTPSRAARRDVPRSSSDNIRSGLIFSQLAFLARHTAFGTGRRPLA